MSFKWYVSSTGEAGDNVVSRSSVGGIADVKPSTNPDEGYWCPVCYDEKKIRTWLEPWSSLCTHCGEWTKDMDKERIKAILKKR